jgi:hypothetical protein
MKKPKDKADGKVANRSQRATAAIIEQRVQDVLRIRLDGAEFWDLRQYVSEKAAANEQPWVIEDGGKPLCDRQLWRYIEQADKLLATSCRTSRKKLLRRHLAQLRSLYARAVQAGDLRTALAVLTDLGKLLDLYPAARTELSGPDGAPLNAVTVELTNDERAVAIAAIFAIVGKSDCRPDPAGEGNALGPPLGTPGIALGGSGDAARRLAD